MKIGIDISQTIYPGGVSEYTKNLVKALLSIDKQSQYTLFFSSLRRSQPGFLDGMGTEARLKEFKIPPTILDFFWNRLHIFPVEWLAGDVDVFHASDWTQPPAEKAKVVTTIHDLSFLRWPKSVHPKVLAVQKRRLQRVKKEAAAIIAVSQATKKEIMELLGISEERITVIYEALPSGVKSVKAEIESREGQDWLERLKKRYGIQKPYFFAYGSSAPRKNISNIIQAFSRGKQIRKSYQLIIVGNFEPKGKLPKEVKLLGFLPRREMLALFSGAQALLYPSLYEGFGLPILEAFCLGVPVVTGNSSSMAEVAGKAAILVDPHQAETIKQGMERSLQPKISKKLVELGKERLDDFSWKKAARETLAVYRSLGGR